MDSDFEKDIATPSMEILTPSFDRGLDTVTEGENDDESDDAPTELEIGESMRGDGVQVGQYCPPPIWSICNSFSRFLTAGHVIISNLSRLQLVKLFAYLLTFGQMKMIHIHMYTKIYVQQM